MLSILLGFSTLAQAFEVSVGCQAGLTAQNLHQASAILTLQKSGMSWKEFVGSQVGRGAKPVNIRGTLFRSRLTMGSLNNENDAQEVLIGRNIPFKGTAELGPKGLALHLQTSGGQYETAPSHRGTRIAAMTIFAGAGESSSLQTSESSDHSDYAMECPFSVFANGQN